MANWIQTFTGRAFSLAAPSPDDVDPLDIACSLAFTNRFGGHARAYNNADHCLRVMQLLADWGCDVPTVLAGLLHDAPETYTGDATTPWKQLLGEPYRRAEAPIVAAVEDRFGLPRGALSAPIIKRADAIVLATEARDLMKPPPRPWDLPTWAVPLRERIVPLRAAEAEELYLEALRDLGAIT